MVDVREIAQHPADIADALIRYLRKGGLRVTKWEDGVWTVERIGSGDTDQILSKWYNAEDAYGAALDLLMKERK